MKTTIIFIIATVILVGCGGQTPPPKTAKDVSDSKASPADGIPQVAPVRKDVSGEAKEDLAKAGEQYEQARKSGINKSNCGSVAGTFASVYQSHPKLVEAKFNEGVVYEECGDQAKAEAIYQQILQKHPNFGPAMNNLGYILFARGNVDGALQYFKRAANVKNSEGYTNLAMIQRNQAISGGGVGLVKEAIDNIHRALAVDSFNIEAYGTMALLLYDHAKTRSQLEMARLICVQATKVNDSYAPIYNILGLILLRMERVTPALAEFRKAVSLDPNLMEAHMNIGAVTLSFRDYKSAEEAFTKVISLNPDKKTKVAALVGLGVAFRGQRQYKEAMAQYKKAQSLDASNLDVVYNMGILVQDYTFDASNPSAGIASLQTASSYLQRYASAGRNQEKVADANKRLKNIQEMLPMLQEQLKMAPGVSGGKK